MLVNLVSINVPSDQRTNAHTLSLQLLWQYMESTASNFLRKTIIFLLRILMYFLLAYIRFLRLKCQTVSDMITNMTQIHYTNKKLLSYSYSLKHEFLTMKFVFSGTEQGEKLRNGSTHTK